MPPERMKPGPKPFKPPRPSAPENISSKPGPTKHSKQPQRPISTSASSSRQPTSRATLAHDASSAEDENLDDDADDPYADEPFPSDKARPSKHATNAADDAMTLSAERATIPSDLLTRLLHEFMSEGMRISKSADKATGMYVETFVREAIARAAFERAEVGGGDGFLEVEDLEKLAPQLVLDF